MSFFVFLCQIASYRTCMFFVFSMDRLSTDVLIHVLRSLDIRSRTRSKGVSTLWNESVKGSHIHRAAHKLKGIMDRNRNDPRKCSFSQCENCVMGATNILDSRVTYSRVSVPYCPTHFISFSGIRHSPGVHCRFKWSRSLLIDRKYYTLSVHPIGIVTKIGRAHV